MSIPVTFMGNVATEVKSLATATGRQVAVFGWQCQTVVGSKEKVG